MLFNSLIFWAFFAIFAVLFFASRRSARHLVSLVGSYVFYGWWDVRFLGLIIGITVLTYLAALRIECSRSAAMRRAWLIAGVAVCLAILGTFKYANFFIDSFVALLDQLGIQSGLHTLSIILPVGISFYTFQALSYTVDVYRGVIPAEPSLLRYATYIAFFPQLVAGPIVRASDFLPQLSHDKSLSWKRSCEAACMVAWGLVLKVVMADSLAIVVDTRFANPANHEGISLLIGVVFYTFQIYGDFAGYSLVAIGLAHFLGYEFNQNFDRPYFSTSFSDFWRRWHISLSSWLRDYLYIPLGGSRKGGGRTMANLMTTMLLGGLWHGAAWNFVAWGGLHGGFLCFQRAGEQTMDRILPVGRRPTVLRGAITLCSGLAVFLCVCVGWVFFRARSFSDAGLILGRIAGADSLSLSQVPQKFHLAKGVALIAGVTLIEAASFRLDYWAIGGRYPALIAFFLFGCVLALTLLGTFQGTSFIYFQF